MVNQKSTKAGRSMRTQRRFSEDVKREVVKRIERNELGIAQASRE